MSENKLRDQLFLKREHTAKNMPQAEIEKAWEFCESYKTFLDIGKTEREVVGYTIALAKENGFEEFNTTKTYKAGDRVYFNNRGKALALAVIGSESVENGTNIIAAHIDSPRLDLKPNPLYESDELALFKTHYYGGIKKYQWTAMPLSLHGVFCKTDGTTINVTIGENDDEPKFVTTLIGRAI